MIAIKKVDHISMGHADWKAQSAFLERLLGFINDDRTPVGRVHLGIVHLFELERADVRSNEEALVDGGFATREQLWREREQFETWSQFALEMLE